MFYHNEIRNVNVKNAVHPIEMCENVPFSLQRLESMHDELSEMQRRRESHLEPLKCACAQQTDHKPGCPYLISPLY